jgi:hypothetical protein
MGRFFGTVCIALLMMGAISLWANRTDAAAMVVTGIGMVGALVPLLGLSYWMKALGRLRNSKAADPLLNASEIEPNERRITGRDGKASDLWV